MAQQFAPADRWPTLAAPHHLDDASVAVLALRHGPE
jgi:hypothetical protein